MKPILSTVPHEKLNEFPWEAQQGSSKAETRIQVCRTQDLTSSLWSGLFMARILLDRFCCADSWDREVRPGNLQQACRHEVEQDIHKKERNKRIPPAHTAPNPQDELEAACTQVRTEKLQRLLGDTISRFIIP